MFDHFRIMASGDEDAGVPGANRHMGYDVGRIRRDNGGHALRDFLISYNGVRHNDR